MKAVADTLAVARSNLIERVSRRAKSRRPYRKAGDDELLALIRRLVDERPTYGYRRIRRLINRRARSRAARILLPRLVRWHEVATGISPLVSTVAPPGGAFGSHFCQPVKCTRTATPATFGQHPA